MEYRRTDRIAVILFALPEQEAATEIFHRQTAGYYLLFPSAKIARQRVEAAAQVLDILPPQIAELAILDHDRVDDRVDARAEPERAAAFQQHAPAAAELGANSRHPFGIGILLAALSQAHLPDRGRARMGRRDPEQAGMRHHIAEVALRRAILGFRNAGGVAVIGLPAAGQDAGGGGMQKV